MVARVKHHGGNTYCAFAVFGRCAKFGRILGDSWHAELGLPGRRGTARPGEAGGLEIAAQVDRVIDAVGGHLHALVAAAQERILIDEGAGPDQRVGAIVEHQHRKGASIRGLLALGRGLAPGIHQIVIRPQIAIEVGRQAPAECNHRAERRVAGVLPFRRIAVVLECQINLRELGADVLVAATCVASTCMAVFDFHCVARRKDFRA